MKTATVLSMRAKLATKLRLFVVNSRIRAKAAGKDDEAEVKRSRLMFGRNRDDQKRKMIAFIKTLRTRTAAAPGGEQPFILRAAGRRQRSSGRSTTRRTGRGRRVVPRRESISPQNGKTALLAGLLALRTAHGQESREQ